MTLPFYVSPEQIAQDKAEFARKGIARGKSIVVLEHGGGVLLMAENPSTLSKIGEIYDRIAFAGVGKFSEFDQLRKVGVRYADVKGYSSRDVVMPVVPMFHANCWAMAFTAPIAGAAIVMPGAKLDGASLYELLDRYKVTCTAAVPTVWFALLQHLATTGSKLPYLKKVVIGGSACPRAMAQTFQDIYGVEVIHALGMT